MIPVQPNVTLSPLRPFTVVFDYFATGEGVRQSVALLNALDPEDARQRYHAALHHAPEYHAWHDLGLTVSDGLDHAVLAHYFSPAFIRHLEQRLVYTGVLLLHWSFRMS